MPLLPVRMLEEIDFEDEGENKYYEGEADWRRGGKNSWRKLENQDDEDEESLPARANQSDE